MLGDFRHVRRAMSISFPAAPPSRVEAIGLLGRYHGRDTGLLCGKTDRDAIDWINAVDWLEQLNFR